ncbi:MAG: hypothetical protein M3Y59_25665 [Myxococcota bacterium]|nr:hypothetical protein [Myxococcota bacterium]
MGLINFLGIKPPAAPQVSSCCAVTSPAKAETAAAAPVQVAAADTFEPAAGAPVVSIDGGAGDASFPDWASLGSGGGGKVGSIGD